MRDQRWRELNELMWTLDIAGLGEEREHTPGEYDSLTDRTFSVLVNGGTATDAALALRELLRKDWGSSLLPETTKSLESWIASAWSRSEFG